LIDKESFGNEAWAQQNFERTLPGKFVLSRVALHKGRPIGYLIASRYHLGFGHIHRLTVRSTFKRKGIGSRLLKSFERDCVKNGMAEITLESLKGRDEANRFYERNGFVTISRERLENYLKAKGKIADAERYSGFSPSGQSLVYIKSLKPKAHTYG